MEFNSVEEAKEYLNKVNEQLKYYDDMEFNLNQDLQRIKSTINTVKDLQSEMRKSNYEFYQEMGQYNEPKPEEKDVAIDDIMDKIL